MVRANRNERRVERYRRRLLNRRLPRIIRVGAAGGLVAIPGPRAETALLDALGDEDPGVRMMVIVALDHRNPNVSVERIVQELRRVHGTAHPGPYRPPDATEIVELELLGWERLPLLDVAREALQSTDVQLRYDAVAILEQLQGAQAEDMLRAAVNDPAPEIRQLAEDVLARRSSGS